MKLPMPRDCEGFHRRDLLKLGTAGLLGLTLADVLRLEAAAAPASRPARARSVIMLWLAGGPATIDMWDLKPEAPENIRGQFRPINTNVPGIQISEHLPRTATVMDKCTLVRSLHHGINDHGRGTVYMTTGNMPTPALGYPTLGSLASKLLPPRPGLPPYAKLGQGFFAGRGGEAGYLGPAYNPFVINNGPQRQVAGRAVNQPRPPGLELPPGFTQEDLDNRNRLLETLDSSFRPFDESDELAAGLDRFHQQALDILRSNRTKEALDVSQEPARMRERYGADAFGQGVLAARRLIEAGVRFVTVNLGGWDTHGQNFNALRTRLLPPLDRTLSALVEDLGERGMLRNTIVYCAGEFGRTPRINRGQGRDHWGRSMAVLLAGGGFKGGYAHGATDAQGMAPANAPCSPDDVSATLFQCLGIEPHHELRSTTGRPIAIFREGKVINQLLG